MVSPVGTQESPLVSVIVTTYNRARLVGRTIDSILTQTYPRFELIIINDGGIDDTPRILSPYHHPRLSYWEKNHEGPAAARNFGMARASGTFIAFCDDDDVWMPSKLAVQMEYLQKHPAVDVCYTGSSIHEGGRDTGYYFLAITHDPLVPLLFVNPAVTSTFIVRSENFKTTGGFDTSAQTEALEDHLMWLRLAKYFSFGGINEPLVRKNQNLRSLGGNYYQNIIKSNRLILRELVAVKREFPGRISAALERQVVAYAKFKEAKAELAAGHRSAALRCCREAIKLNPNNYEAWLLLPACLLPARLFAKLIPRLRQRRGGKLPHLPKGVNIEW